MLVNVGNWQEEAKQAAQGLNLKVGYNIYNDDGQIIPSLTYENNGCYESGILNVGNICWYFDPVHFLFATVSGADLWRIEIPPSWEAGTYTITSIGCLDGFLPCEL